MLAQRGAGRWRLPGRYTGAGVRTAHGLHSLRRYRRRRAAELEGAGAGEFARSHLRPIGIAINEA